MKKLMLILLFVFLSVAQETTHTVKPGDTLWDIAGFYYQNPFLWPYIWRANLTAIEDPHWIYPDEVFVIPPSPEESVATAPSEVPPVTPVTPVEPVVEEVYEAYVPPTLTKPAAEVISVLEREKRIWSEHLIHRAGFIVKDNIPLWGRVSGTEPKGDKVITAYEKVYIDRATDVRVGDKLTVYRPGNGLSSPKTGEYLGREIIILGKLEVQEIGEQGSRCKVIQSYDIFRPGDFVTPYEPILAPIDLSLTPTKRELEAYIVEIKHYMPNLTPPHVLVYIDKGEESDVAAGDLFLVYQERTVGGKKMPDFNIGKVQIISVFEKASIGLLLEDLEAPKIRRGEHCRLAMESR